jgi:hypothetical protein
MTHGSSILAYLVFNPGRASAEGIARPMSIIAWRSPGEDLVCKARLEEQDLVELGLV